MFQRIALSPDEVCGMVVGDVCATPFNPWHEWTVPLPSIPKPYTPTPEPDVSTRQCASLNAIATETRKQIYMQRRQNNV